MGDIVFPKINKATGKVDAAVIPDLSGDYVSTTVSAPAADGGVIGRGNLRLGDIATHPSSDFTLSSGQPVDATNATGVDPTGVTECSAALQTVLDANTQSGDTGAQKIVRLQGIFNTASTLVIKGHVDMSNAVINYSGAGTAVQIGDNTIGQLTRLRVKLGQIVCSSKPATGWAAGTIGLQVRNVFRSTISFQHVQNFETGLQVLGDGSYGLQGSAYNTFLMGTLNNNEINHDIDQVSAGFSNQNTYLGGSCAHSEGTYPATGQVHVKLGVSGTSASLNNNTWVGTSLEGASEQYLIDNNGASNLFLNCRYEFSGHNPPIHAGAQAIRNMIVGGYNVDSLVETIDSGGRATNIIGTQSVSLVTSTDGGVILNPYTGGTTAALTLMRSDWQLHGDTTSSNFTLRLQPSLIRGKTYADTSDRVQVDAVNRKIVMGAGVSTANAGIYWAGGSPEGVITANPGSLYFDYTNGRNYRKLTGTGNTGWCYLHGIARAAQSLAAAGAVTLDAATGGTLRVNLAANATSSTINNALTGARLAVEWAQDATGGRTYVWPTNCRFAGGTAPTDTTASTMTRVEFEYDGTLWLERHRAIAVPTA